MNEMKLKLSRKKKGTFANMKLTVFRQKSIVVGLHISLSVLRILVKDMKISSCKKIQEISVFTGYTEGF